MLTTTDTGRDWIQEPCIPPVGTQNICPWDTKSNPLLVVSLDGFRAEYLTRNLTPTLQRLSSCGIHTPYMRSVYPTLTFPNHYTIVTGLYPESHGIVDNNMYDWRINETFSLSGNVKYQPEWWGGEPLWITAKKQGKKSASFFWVGSDVNISGIQPDIWKQYDGSIAYETRVDTVLEWLSYPKNSRPDFILLYFDEPDHIGHGHGPDSREVNDELVHMDKVINRLMNGLYRRQIHNCVNLIILADHGMERTPCDNRIFINDKIKINNHLIFDGTIGRIYKDYYIKNKVVKKNATVTPVQDLLTSLECKSGQLHATSRQDVPIRHHYMNNNRIGDVVIDVQAKYLVAKDKHRYCLDGNHGYDNLYKSMQALFIAHGPSFKQNYTREPFENIELYNLMSDLVGIKPAPNNGTYGSLHDILRSPPTTNHKNNTPLGTCSAENGPPSIPSGVNNCLCVNKTFVNPPANTQDHQLPFGTVVSENDHEICMISTSSYSSGYSNRLHMPLWTSFNLKLKQKVYTNNPNPCLVLDPRVNYVTCDEYSNNETSMIHTFLYRPEFHDSSEGLTSNLVPMLAGFKNGIWNYMLKVLQDYAIQSDVDVTIGTAFDYNHDGLWEDLINETKFVDSSNTVPIPTHYYIIIIRCQDQTISMEECPFSQLDILSLILPHKEKVPDCRPEEEYLLNNVARVRDIELLTGLRFLTKFSDDVSAKLRTFLPTSLWKTKTMSLTWRDLPCKDQQPKNNTCPGKIPLLLISLDGFRAEYLNRHITPVIQKMRDCGVHTPYMRSAFPTVTFPNHYTIVTGLYPESHGIISNNMYDPDIGEVFTLSSKTKGDPRWWGGEPMWITAKKQNKKTATFFWPGSDVNISGIYPDIWKLYDGSVGYPKRVDTVLEWLTLPEDRKPDFITLYFDQPDHAGHASGPDSENVNSQLQVVDGLIGQLMDSLYHKDLHNCVNIIVLADHGFDSVSCDQVVKLSPYIDVKKMMIFGGTFGRIERDYIKQSKYKVLNNTNVQPVEEIVDNLMCKNDAMKVFTKETLPRRHHYLNNKRIGDILLDLRREWLVTDANSFYCYGGNHGWDNIYKTMHALFLAHGPGFKQQIQIEPFENIELYNLMAEILGITPAPNNGTMGSLHHILSNPKPLNQSSQPHLVNTSCTPTDSASRQEVLQTVCGCGTMNVTLDNLTSVSDNNKAVPFGIPSSVSIDQNRICLLSYPRISTLYDKTISDPLAVMFTLSQQNIPPRKITDNSTNNPCIMKDPGIDNVPTNCNDLYQLQDQNITIQPLYHTGLIKPTADRDVNFVSSLIPTYDEFSSGIWLFTWQLVQEYVNKYGSISIITGPIYDYNGDGLMDQNKKSFQHGNDTFAVPSHIYIIMIKCKTVGDMLPCNRNVDIQSFVLPHIPVIPNCMYKSDFLKDNIARVRDIEQLTGLQFFTTGQFTVAMAARLRTYLPVNVWSTELIMKWLDKPCPSQPASCPSNYRPLLLISLDGFRADYLVRNFTPYVRKLSQCGVHAPYMRSVYPTKTFPNHYTIVTGLYPESHGIIDNNMYDPNIGQKFSMSAKNASDTRWWGGEPIWNTAVQQNRTAATYFWPGSEYEISGIRPTYYKEYDGKIPFDARVDTILSWIDNEQPDFLTLYFSEPDHTGHNYGPDDVVKGLYHRNMDKCVDIIIVADHDYLTRYYDMYIYEGAFSRINNKYKYAKDGLAVVSNPESVSSIIANLTCKNPHFDVYRKSELPKRHHYANNKRIEDIIVDVETDWLVTFRSLSNYGKKYCKGGNHGYDNTYKTMEALFLAHGPSFKQNLIIDSFENIELYNLMCDILNITAAPNNGTDGTLDEILRSPNLIKVEKSQKYNTSTTFDKELFTAITTSDSCKGTCSFLSTQVMQDMIKHLQNYTNNNPESHKHVPFGIPSLISPDDAEVNLLYQPEFVTAYNTELQFPVWISDNVTKPGECILPDLRVNTRLDLVREEKCKTNFGLPNNTYSWNSLVYKGNHAVDPYSSLSSVFVPVLKSFKEGIWYEVQKLIFKWTKQFKYLNVSVERYLSNNEARVRDVEWLSGLQFYTSIDNKIAVKLRTYLPSGLWK
ncbi:hypothetical protein KUTeg_016533 [Tegillarca granosa]|uniref:Ectonucleotide pyrophosphatase/phosphodiesterase family member 3 n=1 Tax=Tegillarca granosa TaxID=220873 RepID=A0ABQ9EL50_TEGGR|nr:hypothetical protein KUTeg_016533 [Tegillarca granosa]